MESSSDIVQFKGDSIAANKTTLGLSVEFPEYYKAIRDEEEKRT